MATVPMKQLLEAGVHFGHQTKRWNPKMAPYIFGEKNGVYIINLQKTSKMIDEVYSYVRDIARQGEIMLFVGSKKQAQESVEEEAKRCGMFYVNQRWLGGFLTNFETIKKRIYKLRELEEMKEKGIFLTLPPQEMRTKEKELSKLQKFFQGVKSMPKLPGAIFITDLKKERTAMLEAKKLEIPVVAIVDTNCDPGEADYMIPANDDAVRAIKLITSVIANAIIEGRDGVQVPFSFEEKSEILSEEEEKKLDELAAEFEKKFAKEFDD